MIINFLAAKSTSCRSGNRQHPCCLKINYYYLNL